MHGLGEIVLQSQQGKTESSKIGGSKKIYLIFRTLYFWKHYTYKGIILQFETPVGMILNSAFSKKNIQIFEARKLIEDIKFRLECFFTCPSTYELNVI